MHFFDIIVEKKQFTCKPQFPVTYDGKNIVCPVQNCDGCWQNHSAGSIAILQHLINVHRFSILLNGDGTLVEQIRGEIQKLGHLLPWIPESVGAIGKVEVQRPDPHFNGF